MKVNPKMLLKYAKAKTKFHEKVADLDTKGGGGRVSSDKEKSDALNDAFTSVLTTEDKIDVPIPENKEYEFPSDYIEINTGVVKERL